MRAKKHLGQNFLRNKEIAEKIADLIPDKTPVVEIGPGDGALTEALLRTGHRVIGVEIDPEMIRRLKVKFKNNKDFSIFPENILKCEWKDISVDFNYINVAGNLPYHLASPILFKVFDHVRTSNIPLIDKMIVMLQYEVGQRVVAHHGSREFGGLSLLTRYHGKSSLNFKVDRKHFKPKPKVNGAVITTNFNSANDFRLLPDYDIFRHIVRGCFSQRRKMMRNSLSSLKNLPEGWKEIPFDFSLRPEQVSFEEFVHLTNQLIKLSHNTLTWQ